MALEAKLVQKLGQSLLMTPQLQQAIKLLQLGRLEYLEAIEKELLDNPLLEELKEGGEESTQPPPNIEADSSTGESGSLAESSGSADANDNSGNTSGATDELVGTSPEAAEPTVDWENYLESFTDSSGAATPRGLIDHEDRPTLEASTAKTESLFEHLVSQIRMAGIPETDEKIALHIIGNLDKRGYLGESLEDIASSCGCDLTEIQRVLEYIRSLDPPGVAARDLKECLILQLESLGLGEGLAAKIVRDHLDKLEKRRYDQIAKAEKVEVDDVYKAVTTIRALEPRPGRPFADESARYITADIYVYKVGNEYVISLNDEGMPRLRVSPYYLKLLRDKNEENIPNKAYLNDRLKAATWLIKSIQQRQQTIYKVTESIVKFQREFLDFGISKLKPLVLKDVADDIGMHESTVSRITTEKYVHTPQGVFELKFFFTTGIKGGEGDVSSSSVKQRIKDIITAETAEDPVSDQAIVEMLKKEGISIARRTVAKYREGLGIQSSASRKRPF